MKELLYDWGGLNVWLFHSINDLRAVWLDQLMLWGTMLGEHTNIIILLCLLSLAALNAVSRAAIHGVTGDTERVARLWLGVIAVLVLGYWLDSIVIGWLKPYVSFIRPVLALGEANVNTVGVARFQHSFPSGHAAFAMLVCAALWPLTRGWRIFGIVFALWVGLSRISVGAHFPADVLGGYGISLIMVGLARWSIRYWALFSTRILPRKQLMIKAKAISD